MICAEVGLNHNGNVFRAIDMVRVAAGCGVDAVKFQVFRADEFVAEGIPFTYQQKPHLMPSKIVTESIDYLAGVAPALQNLREDMNAMFKRHELPDEAWAEIKNVCDVEGVEFMATPMGIDSLNLILDVGVKRIKVASSDLTNIPLLEAMGATGLPVILSTGMADDRDVIGVKVPLSIRTGKMTLCVCTSEYPTPPEHANLKRFVYRNYTSKAGLSDHTQGNTAAIMAVAYGATYFEKHFTLDHGLAGPDHWFSANPDELKSWVNAIKEAQLMVGSGKFVPTESEMENRRTWRKSWVANVPIKEGEPINQSMFTPKRVKGGCMPASEPIPDGIADHDYEEGDPISQYDKLWQTKEDE